MRLKIFFIAFLVSLPFWWGVNVFQKNLEDFFYAQISQPFVETSEIKIPEKPTIRLQVKSAISAKVNKNGERQIVFKENINQPLLIASLTKLMTAVILLENIPDNDFLKTITISKEAATQENVPNYGNLKTGEKVSVKQLLELMLIYSSNDAAWALSEVIGTENFVEKMNQKAESLELKNTHFVNPTGLDPENLHYDPTLIDYFNYSTAKELVKIAQYILKEYPAIFDISLSEGPYPIKNGVSNLILPKELKILGGKTGYTDESGGSMLLVLVDENENFIVNVILGASSQETRIQEMQKLIDWLSQ